VLTYLYERASSISFYSAEPVLIEIKVKEEQIAKRTGLSIRAVSQAIIRLKLTAQSEFPDTEMFSRIRLRPACMFYCTVKRGSLCRAARTLMVCATKTATVRISLHRRKRERN